jgi:hypothetical protein
LTDKYQICEKTRSYGGFRPFSEKRGPREDQLSKEASIRDAHVIRRRIWGDEESWKILSNMMDPDDVLAFLRFVAEYPGITWTILRHQGPTLMGDMNTGSSREVFQHAVDNLIQAAI